MRGPCHAVGSTGLTGGSSKKQQQTRFLTQEFRKLNGDLGMIWMDLDGFGWVWMDLDGFGWILFKFL